MTTYVDSSALLKRYVDEPDSDAAVALMAADPELVTGKHTIVEIRRHLARLLSEAHWASARAAFAADLEAFALIEIDSATCELAATLAEQSGVRTLDALHLGAARRLGIGVQFLTFDTKQAAAGRSVGLHVIGA